VEVPPPAERGEDIYILLRLLLSFPLHCWQELMDVRRWGGRKKKFKVLRDLVTVFAFDQKPEEKTREEGKGKKKKKRSVRLSRRAVCLLLFRKAANGEKREGGGGEESWGGGKALSMRSSFQRAPVIVRGGRSGVAQGGGQKRGF